VITSIEGGENGEHLVETPQQRETLRTEFARLTRRYMRLNWSMNARDQQERAALNKTLMSMFCALNPNSTHFWHQDFDVVIRGMRRAS
jgi:hypothetical protein